MPWSHLLHDHLASPGEGDHVARLQHVVELCILNRPAASGIFLRKIKRGATETPIRVSSSTRLHRGDLHAVSCVDRRGGAIGAYGADAQAHRRPAESRAAVAPPT
jgi:hypothetical protein